MTAPTVTMEPCGASFRHASDTWDIVLPLDRLPTWIGFHRRLRDRQNGRFARFYADDIKALETFQRGLK